MAFLDLEPKDDHELRLRTLLEWAHSITSLELLSPTAMRGGARGPTDDIGTRGERLASFLASLSTESKSNIVSRLNKFYPIHSIQTTRKRAGWVDMKIAERFRQVSGISPSQASDGLLRLMALCAIPEFSETASLIMLDEVEDGVEPHVLPEIIGQIVSESSSQFMFTSHSPLLVNFYRPDDIHILTRRQSGSVATCPFSDLDFWKQGSEYFGPGELWSMAERKSFQREVVHRSRSSPRNRNSRFSSKLAYRFMTS